MATDNIDAETLQAEAFQARVIADFLEEGGYANLGEAMERLGLDWRGLENLIYQLCLQRLAGGPTQH